MEYQQLKIEQPEPGKWFGIAFKPYQDPKDDKVSQKGLSKQCTIYGFGNVSLKYAHPKFINLNELYHDQLSNGFRLYKLYNPSNSYRGILFLTSNCTSCNQIKVSTRNKAVPETTKSSTLNLTKGSLEFSFIILPKTFNYLLLHTIDKKSSNIFFSVNVTQSFAYKISDINYFPLIRKNFGELSIYDYLSLETERKFPLIQGSPIRVHFQIEDLVDTGGTLTIRVTKEFTVFELCKPHLVICLNRDVPSIPESTEKCVLGPTLISSPILSDGNNIIHIPYPESGQWFLSFDVFCKEKNSNSTDIFAIYNLLIFSSQCIAGRCAEHNGKCMLSEDSGILYTFCYCVRGYKGWDCSNDNDLESNISPLFATLLLTLSNLFFVPSVVISMIRGLYTEAIIYFFGMAFSITYHACDEQEIRSAFCNSYIDLLQFADFYCNLLGIWVTPVAMANLPPRYTSIAHIMGAIFISFGTLWDKHSYLLSVIPASFGLILILYSWIYRCCKHRKLFPSKKYLTVCLPIGTSLVSFALICYTLLQTKRNYHMVHSVWHMVMALSLLFLLPGKKDLQENS